MKKPLWYREASALIDADLASGAIDQRRDVALAILAERERCAEIFRWFRKEAVLMVLDSHTNDVANAAIQKIESGEA